MANWVDGATHGAVLTAVHARIPMPTQDDHQAAQLANARANAGFWTTMSDVQADQITGLKGVAVKAAAAAASAEPAAAVAAEKARTTADQLARAERGEDVGPVPPPMTRVAMLRLLGWTEADAAHPGRLAQIDPAAWEELMAEIMPRRQGSPSPAQRARTCPGRSITCCAPRSSPRAAWRTAWRSRRKRPLACCGN